MSGNQTIGFGGGCYWCTEAVFQSVKGVVEVEQGWVSSVEPHEEFSEGVMVHYDPDEVSLEVLVEIHLRSHSSQSEHSFRKKYRSAIYVFDWSQECDVEDALEAVRSKFEAPVITKVLPFKAFKLSDPAGHNYYYSDPAKPFCVRHIEPKLQKLKAKFPEQIDLKSPS